MQRFLRYPETSSSSVIGRHRAQKAAISSRACRVGGARRLGGTGARTEAGLEYVYSLISEGQEIPTSSARRWIAPLKPSPSIALTYSIASPPRPQPVKQCQNSVSGLT